MFIIR